MGKDLKGKELGNGIVQRKDGMYTGRYVDRFGKRKTVYSKKLKDIREILSTAIYEDSKKLNVVNNNIRLDDWYEKWLEIHKYNVIRSSTRNTYISVYKKHISPILGKLKLQDITHLQVKHLINNLDKDGYGFETKSRVKILLVDMFNKAMIDDFISKNPAKGISVERDEEKEIRVLTLEEQTEFFNACKGTFYDNFFIVAVSTGLRIGEISSLTMGDLDFERKVIGVSKTLLYQKLEELGDTKKEFHINPPKTKTSKREVPMNKQCEIALKKQWMQKNVISNKSPKQVDEEFKNLLFTTKFNTPINPQIIIDAIKKIVDEINICKDPLEEIELFSSHCFRHVFATRCFEAGIQPKTVQSYLGHASLQMTMDLYTSVLGKHKQDEMEKLEETMDAVFNNGDNLVESQYNKIVNAKAKKKVISLKEVSNG
jgi:integrase